MTSFSDLITRLERLLFTTPGSGGSNYDFWTPQIKKDLINEAHQDVQMELLESYDTRYFCALEDVTAAAGEINLGALKLPFLRLFAVHKQSGSNWLGEPYVRVVSAAEAWPATVGYERWFPIGQKLKSRDETLGGVYRLTYAYRLKPLVEAGDVSEIPEEYQELMLYRAAYVGSLQAREKEIAQFFGSEYQQRLARMRQTAAKRFQNQRWKIQSVEDYGDGFSVPPTTVTIP